MLHKIQIVEAPDWSPEELHLDLHSTKLQLPERETELNAQLYFFKLSWDLYCSSISGMETSSGLKRSKITMCLQGSLVEA